MPHFHEPAVFCSFTAAFGDTENRVKKKKKSIAAMQNPGVWLERPEGSAPASGAVDLSTRCICLRLRVVSYLQPQMRDRSRVSNGPASALHLDPGRPPFKAEALIWGFNPSSHTHTPPPTPVDLDRGGSARPP